jgi:CRP-like cAMP-binding protein
MVEINVFRNVQNPRELTAGEVLFSQGEEGDLMFAVLEGQLDLSVAGRVVDHIGPGQIVGEMALIDRSPRSATATAAVPTKVAPVDKKAFTYLVQEHPTFALLVMEVMAERLRRANQTHG